MARLTHAPALTGLDSGRFADALAGVHLEPHAFEVGNAVVEAMFAREVDIAYLGPNPAINGCVRSGGNDVVILAGAAEGGSAFVVRGIASTEELRGKRIATPQIASTQDIALRSYLRAHDLAKDVTILPLATPILLTAFSRGEIDGAWVSEPLASQLLALDGARLLLDEASLWPEGRYPTTVVAVRRDYLKAAPEVVDRFVRAHAHEVRFIERHRAAGLDASVTAMRAIAGRQLDPAIAKAAWARIHFSTELPPGALPRLARDARGAGFLPQSALGGLVEPGPLERAP